MLTLHQRRRLREIEYSRRAQKFVGLEAYQQNSSEVDDDPLDASRGMILGSAVGLVIWIALIAFFIYIGD